MRLVIPGSMLTALGFQTILASFFIASWGCVENEITRLLHRITRVVRRLLS